MEDYKEVESIYSLGMEKGRLYETIVTTSNRKGRGNAAPIGVVCKNPREVVLYLYDGSHTLSNILDTGRFAVNIIHDPLIFTEATLGDLEDEYFTNFSNYLVLGGVSSFFTAKTKEIREVKKRNKFGESRLFIVTANVDKIFKGKDVREPLNRGIYAVIESLIKYTRLEFTEDREAILDHILEMKRVVDRVGSAREKLAMKKILDSISNRF